MRGHAVVLKVVVPMELSLLNLSAIGIGIFVALLYFTGQIRGWLVLAITVLLFPATILLMTALERSHSRDREHEYDTTNMLAPYCTEACRQQSLAVPFCAKACDCWGTRIRHRFTYAELMAAVKGGSDGQDRLTMERTLQNCIMRVYEDERAPPR
jgi:hypothetical protein